LRNLGIIIKKVPSIPQLSVLNFDIDYTTKTLKYDSVQKAQDARRKIFQEWGHTY
jgi:hypothetical protein